MSLTQRRLRYKNHRQNYLEYMLKNVTAIFAARVWKSQAVLKNANLKDLYAGRRVKIICIISAAVICLAYCGLLAASATYLAPELFWIDACLLGVLAFCWEAIYVCDLVAINRLIAEKTFNPNNKTH